MGENIKLICYSYNMNKSLKEYARELRNNLTPQEYKLWQILRNRQFYQLRFNRQYIVGNYIVDFICKSEHIIIEIDGGQHSKPDEISYDNKRTEYFESKGYKVLRFWNNDIDENLSGVYEKLKEAFNKR